MPYEPPFERRVLSLNRSLIAAGGAVTREDAMRKTVLYIAMSLDGLIADQQGGVDWLCGHGEEPDAFDSYADFIKGVDTVLMGWNTYHQVTTELAPGAWPYEGLCAYVFTHRSVAPREGVTFTDEDPQALIDRLRLAPGKDIWVCGGASIAGQLTARDAIDRFHISVIPTLLGRGVRLFEGGLPQARLRLVGTRAYDGIVDLVYERERAAAQ